MMKIRANESQERKESHPQRRQYDKSRSLTALDLFAELQSDKLFLTYSFAFLF